MSPRYRNERRAFLRGSRLHVFYVLDRERQAIRVARLPLANAHEGRFLAREGHIVAGEGRLFATEGHVIAHMSPATGYGGGNLACSPPPLPDARH